MLSSKNLRLASQQLRDMCNQCGLLSMSEIPCIMSACLVSMEIHQSIHIMTDSVKVEEKMSSSVPLSTPRDASCTHILVFPTSATAQVSRYCETLNPRIHTCQPFHILWNPGTFECIPRSALISKYCKFTYFIFYRIYCV